MGNAFALKYRPEITPDPNKETAFDPLYGFPSGRKERGMWGLIGVVFGWNRVVGMLGCCYHPRID